MSTDLSQYSVILHFLTVMKMMLCGIKVWYIQWIVLLYCFTGEKKNFSRQNLYKPVLKNLMHYFKCIKHHIPFSLTS